MTVWIVQSVIVLISVLVGYAMGVGKVKDPEVAPTKPPQSSEDSGRSAVPPPRDPTRPSH